MGIGRDLNEQGVKHYNNGDLDGMMSLYADNAVLTTPDGRFEGRDAIRAQWEQQRAAFPDGQVEVHRDVEDRNLIASEFTFRGTNRGALAMPDGTELPATGKSIELKGVTIA